MRWMKDVPLSDRTSITTYQSTTTLYTVYQSVDSIPPLQDWISTVTLEATTAQTKTQWTEPNTAVVDRLCYLSF
jgi:hypothetical protein